MMTADQLSDVERERLRVVFTSHCPLRRMTFEQAIAWPPMLAVLRMAARSFDARKQSLAHPSQRAAVHAAANWYALPAQRTRDYQPGRKAKTKGAIPMPARPDVKQRQGNDVEDYADSHTAQP